VADSSRQHGASLQGRGHPAVRVVSPYGSAMVRRRAQDNRTKRISSTIVHIVMLVTTAFALLDLSLLLTSGHH
jgi:hypothetical protein